jgi:hypothetical protein
MIKNKLLIASLIGISGTDSAFATERSDYDLKNAQYYQQGIHAGAFTILPTLDFNNEYNSNVFKKDTKNSNGAPVAQSLRPDSYIAHFKPGLQARSNWNRHALNLKFDTDLAQYATLPSQNNYNDLKTQVNGRLDVVRDSHLDGAFAYNSVHEDRGSPDQISGIGPTLYNTKVMDTSYTHKLNRVSVNAGLNATRYDYQDLATSVQGTPLLMSTRNHWEYLPTIRLGYEIQPAYEAFAKFVYKDASYDGLVLSNGAGTAYNRNSTGYNALGGIAFQLTDLVTADASVGYLQRTYEDSRLSKISGVNGFVNLKWRPTMLTTVNGRVSRDINETTQQSVSGILATGVALDVEHELMRNVFLMAGADYTNNDYDGYVQNNTPGAINQKNRIDNLYGANVGAKYLLNTYLSTDLSYTYQNRDVNYLGNNYEVNQVMLNLRGAY